ncbi:MAG: helix-hairpin-helix domain-containing protein [Negativicutes bacterium]|jgi:competence protein ComEA
MDPQRKKLLIVSVIFIAVLVTAYFILWREPVVPDVVNPATKPLAQTVSNDVVVYVSGGVIKPGVYKLPTKSRAIDAVNAAGGLAIGANPGAVNMAQVCLDGMHINVPMKFSQDNNVSPSVNPDGTPAMAYTPDLSLNVQKISINTADKVSISALPGIGDALAQRIIDYRTKNGSFTVIEDVKKVSGIGDARYNKIKDQITL